MYPKDVFKECIKRTYLRNVSKERIAGMYPKDVFKECIQEMYLGNVSRECIKGTYSTVESDLPDEDHPAFITNS